jgi:cardiolipin synthase
VRYSWRMIQWLLPHLSAVLLVLFEAVMLAIALVVAPRDRLPSSALAWILVIVSIPILGILLFAVIGNPKLPAQRRERQRSMDERIEAYARVVEHPAPGSDTPRWLTDIVRMNRAVGAFPLLDGNEATLIPHFDEQLEALTKAVRGASRFVHAEFYTLGLDEVTEPFFTALEQAAARGVNVRVLVDHLGSHRYPGFDRAKRFFAETGIAWHLMLPVQPLRGRYQRPDLRNHRKLVVVDGAHGFVGSLNLIEPGYELKANHKRGLRWRDMLVEVRGPVVQELDQVFATDWYSETDELLSTSRVEGVADDADPETLLCQIAPSGPAYDAENNLALFNSLIYAAEHRLAIATPYFVPDQSLLSAILTAAKRGVQVELFVGEIVDQAVVFHAQHSYYAALLKAGVTIHLYPAPTVLHAKHMTVDDLVTVVGSSNMDIRSFQLDFELTMLVCSRSFTDRMRRVEDEYRGLSRELTSEEWIQRSSGHRWLDDLARLTSALQ